MEVEHGKIQRFLPVFDGLPVLAQRAVSRAGHVAEDFVEENWRRRVDEMPLLLLFWGRIVVGGGAHCSGDGGNLA